MKLLKNVLATLIDRHSKAVMLVILLITLAMIPGLKKIQIVSQPPENGFINPNEFVRNVIEVKKTFGSNSRTIVLAVEAQGSHTLLEPEAVTLINQMTAKLKLVPMVFRDTILSMSTISDVENGKDGITSIPLFKKAPTNYFEIEELKKRISANEFIYGRLISKDFKTTMLVANATEAGSLYTLHDQLAEAFKDVLTPAGAKDVPFVVSIAGDTEVCYQLETNIQKDAVLFLGIAMLLIIGSFYFMFNTWKGVVLLIATMIVGISWTMGLIGYYGEPISILSAMLPVVIVVIGSSYAIHVFHALSEDTQHAQHFKPAFIGVLDRLFSPLTMSTSTTVVGGLSLLSFKVRMIQHFGVFTAVGTFVTYMVSLILIPAMYRSLRRQVSKIEDQIEKTFLTSAHHVFDIANSTIQLIPVAGPMTQAVTGTVQSSLKQGIMGVFNGLKQGNLIERGLIVVSKTVSRHPWYIILITLSLVAVSFVQMSKVTIGFDNIAMLPSNYSVKGVMQRLDKHFGGIQGFDMMLDSGKPNGALDPEFMKKVDEFGKRARTIKTVTYVFSAVDLLKKMDNILNPEHKENIPATTDTAAQYLFLLGSSGGGVSLDSLLTSDHQKMRINLTLSVSDTQKVEQIYEELKVIIHDVFGTETKAALGGGLVANVGLLHYIVWGKIQNIMLSLLLILLIVSMVYKSFTRGMLSIISLPIGVIANFGLMGYMGIRLDITTAIITSFAMGMGVDFSIHFLSAVKSEFDKCHNLEKALEKALTGPGVSIAYNAISTKIGFSALLFSHFASIHTFATLMCFNMMILATSALTFLPALIRIAEPECITGHRERHKIVEPRLTFAVKIAMSVLVCATLLTGIIIVNAKA